MQCKRLQILAYETGLEVFRGFHECQQIVNRFLFSWRNFMTSLSCQILYCVSSTSTNKHENVLSQLKKSLHVQSFLYLRISKHFKQTLCLILRIGLNEVTQHLLSRHLGYFARVDFKDRSFHGNRVSSNSLEVLPILDYKIFGAENSFDYTIKQ